MAGGPAPAPAAPAGRELEAAPRPLLEELERLRKRVGQQEHSLTALAQAVLVLRSGSEALREENRELRLQLQSKRRSPAYGRVSAPTHHRADLGWSRKEGEVW